MDNKKQKLLLEYLISSPDTFAICQAIIKPQYFNPELRNVVKFIKEYYERYKVTPEPEQISSETDTEVKKQAITADQVQYCITEVEAFCRQQAVTGAILECVPLVNEGRDYGTIEKKIREAILISLNRDLGVRYFDNPRKRLEQMLLENPTEPTGWTEVDKLLFGGISRQELLLVSAGTGGGKSITLANLAFNFLKRKRNVLYVSLELPVKRILQRFDTMFSAISNQNWEQHIDDIVYHVTSAGEQCGILDVVKLPSGTRAHQLRAFLNEYHLRYDFVPDLYVLDYVDKMYPNENIDLADVWTKDKLCSEQLREIGVDYNMFVATASQLNRQAVKQITHDHSHIAGGISKINESDTYWSILMTDRMKIVGEVIFQIQKTRNSDGDGKVVYLKWDAKTLRIVDREDKGLEFNKKDKFKQKIFFDEQPTGDRLLSLMTSNK